MEGNTFLGDELTDLLGRFALVHAQHLDVGLLQGLLHPPQRREHHAAWRAPRRPELDQHDLVTPHRFQFDRCTGEVGEPKRGRRRAELEIAERRDRSGDLGEDELHLVIDPHGEDGEENRGGHDTPPPPTLGRCCPGGRSPGVGQSVRPRMCIDSGHPVGI